jgi:hypothetical protein
MVSNCVSHLAATLEILGPTILVLQGDKAMTTWAILKPGRSYETPFLKEAHLGQQRMLVCNFSHPSAHGFQRWGANLDSTYLTEIVQPTLLEALRWS